MKKPVNEDKYSPQLLQLGKKQEIKNFNFSVAKNIHSIRLKRRISVHELSVLSGINACHIYRIEKNEKHVGLDSIVKLANGLGVSVEDLMPWDTEDDLIKSIKFILYGCSQRELKEIRSYLKANYEHKEL